MAPGVEIVQSHFQAGNSLPPMWHGCRFGAAARWWSHPRFAVTATNHGRARLPLFRPFELTCRAGDLVIDRGVGAQWRKSALALQR